MLYYLSQIEIEIGEKTRPLLIFRGDIVGGVCPVQ